MAAVKALIFDLDGILVDTVDLHYRAWKHLADIYGISFSRDDMQRFRGRQRRDCVISLFAPHPLTEAQINEYVAIKTNQYTAMLAQTDGEALLMPGARYLVHSAKASGLKLGVASASVNAIEVLKRVKLYDFFDAIGDGTIVARSKPKPDIFLWTAGALGVRPHQTIVFEDSAAGVHAARTAGMFVVGVGSDDAVNGAHLIVPAMTAIELDALLRAASDTIRTIG